MIIMVTVAPVNRCVALAFKEILKVHVNSFLSVRNQAPVKSMRSMPSD
jgi:hypothetical protein